MKFSDNIVIIPAYNEADHIKSVVIGAKKAGAADVIVIDDGSDDQTAYLAHNAGAKVIRHPFNMGYGVALQTGYKYAAAKGYVHLVQMDADGQHDPADIPLLLKQIEALGCDVLIGSRYLAGGADKANSLKLAAVWLFRLIIRVTTGTSISDPTSGFQCISSSAFPFITHDGFPWDYPDADMVIMLLRAGFSVKEIPVKMTENNMRKGMHAGIFTKAYYFFKVFLLIFLALLGNRSDYCRKKECRT